MNVGDRVLYVPSKDHALVMNTSGKFAGLYAWTHHIAKDKSGKVEAESKPATTKNVGIAIEQIRRGIGTRKREHLVAMKPQCTWPATVTAVDGETVSLEIQHPTGVILVRDKIAIDATGKPDTCHEEGE